MTVVENDNIRDGGYIVFDVEPDLCREQVTVAQDDDEYLPGTVLKDGGAGKFIRWDGTGDIAGILFSRRDASESDARGVMSARLTVYKIPLLVWDESVTEAQMAAGIAAMKAAHLIGRSAD